jgi:hypothetical protein
MSDPDRARAEQAEARAAAAKRLLEDPMLVEALENVRMGAIKSWRATSADDKGKEAREIAWLTVKVVDRIETELQNVINNGMIAASRVQAPLR